MKKGKFISIVIALIVMCSPFYGCDLVNGYKTGDYKSIEDNAKKYIEIIKSIK